MSIKLRPMLAFKRVVLFGHALSALPKLRSVGGWSYRRLWHHTVRVWVLLGVELERSSSSR